MLNFNKVDTPAGSAVQFRISNPIPTIRHKIAGIRKPEPRVWFQRKVDQALVAFFDWALDKRAVQQVIADKFLGGTPLCAVLNHAVEDQVEHSIASNTVDADDIEGLERYVNEAMENFAVEVDNIEGLDRHINRAVVDELEEQIPNYLKDHKVEAEDIEDLEDFVQNMIDESEIDSGKIEGLESAIKDVVEAQVTEAVDIIDVDAIKGLDVAVREIVSENLKHGDMVHEIASHVTEVIIDKLR